MSARNGDKSRHGAQRKRKLVRREKMRELRKQLTPAANAKATGEQPAAHE